MINFIKNLVSPGKEPQSKNETSFKKESSSLFDDFAYSNQNNAIVVVPKSDRDNSLYQKTLEEETQSLQNENDVAQIIIIQEEDKPQEPQKESVVIINPQISTADDVLAPKDNTNIQTQEVQEKPKYEYDFSINLSKEYQDDLEDFKNNWEENKERYQSVSEKTGVPAELIAAIHWRESGGDFDTYLHNGMPLGKTIEIKSRGADNEKVYFDNWEEAAIDALTFERDSSYVKKEDFKSQLDFAERYNGLGYRKKGINSPYIWSGTDKYTEGQGKYSADGKFDEKCSEDQIGIAVMLQALYS